MSIEEKASLLAAKYSSKYDKSKSSEGSGSKLKREDSTDDLMKSIALAKERRQKRLEELMKVKIDITIILEQIIKIFTILYSL